jgi:hypothetical protein
MSSLMVGRGHPATTWGLPGQSTLALESIIALLSIIGGATATMKYIYWRQLRA